MFEPGLGYALVALSFYRYRWSPRPRYKNAGKPGNQKKTVIDRTENVRLARLYIRKSREAGYRGYPRRDLQAVGRID